MLHEGRRRGGSEVVDGRDREPPVLHEERARQDLPDRALPVEHRAEGEGHREAHGQHEQRRRQDAAGAARVERRERHPAMALELAEQVTGDEKPGDHEEHVDAEVAARQAARPEVVADDGDDRGGTQRLHLDAEPAPRVLVVAHAAIQPGRRRACRALVRRVPR